MKEKKSTLLKMVVGVLLLASLAALFLPWTTFAIDGKPLEQHLDRIGALSGMPAGSVRTMLEQELAKELGGSVANTMLDSLMSGKTSFIRPAVMLAKGGDMIEDMVGPMLENLYSSVSPSSQEELLVTGMVNKIMDWTVGEMRLFSGLYWGVIALLVVFAVLAFVCFCKGKRGGMIPHLVLTAYLCAVTLFGVWQANSVVNLYAEILEAVPDVKMGLAMLGIRSLRNIFSLGCGAWLCALCAALAFALSFVKSRKPAPVEATVEAPVLSPVAEVKAEASVVEAPAEEPKTEEIPETEKEQEPEA